MKNITSDIIYVGVNDHKVDLFEGQYKVPNGMCYNSYVVMDEKVTVFDTVDANFTDEWLQNIDKALEGKKPDYLVVQHMEPDHSANIFNFASKYKDTIIVANAKTFAMIKQFFGTEFEDRRLVVKDGESLNTGEHTFTFVFAPMVHWPEVMVTYDSYDKVLFSADGFGKFGILEADEEWADEARRYYIGIVGKYGIPVQNLLKKAATLDISIICPLHGPILTENLGYYLDLYNTWSSYSVETDGILLAYTSVYGNTKKAILILEDELKKLGCKNIVTADLARCDMSKAVSDAFRYGKLVLATPTYNGDVFPFMREFINDLTERSYKNRTVALIENGSWAPTAAKAMRNSLEKCKNINFTDTTITINSAVNEDTINSIKKLAKELSK